LRFFDKRVTPAIPISDGLDLPATVMSLFSKTLGPLGWLFFLLCVAACWYIMGSELDSRAAGEEELHLVGSTIWTTAAQLLMLAFGIFTLFAARHLHVFCFPQTIERALAETWAVFLIAVPVLGMIDRRLERRQYENASEPERAARHRASNFHLLVIVIGVFVVLLTLGALADGYIPTHAG
jgi:hypothetical protein